MLQGVGGGKGGKDRQSREKNCMNLPKKNFLETVTFKKNKRINCEVI